MALSEEQIARARNKAKEYLELGILSLAVSLGERPESVSPTMDIPVEPDDIRHSGYVALVSMAQSLEQIDQ